MTLRSILVQLDDAPACESRIRAAALLAKRCASALTGCYAAQASAAMQQDQALLTVAEIASNLSAKEMRQRVEAQFRQIADADEVASAVFPIRGNDIERGFVDAVRCADLSIVGQPPVDNDRTDFQRRLVENALLEGGAPLLVIPGARLTEDIGKRILVAWNGGRESARAVRDALPLLCTARHVSVVSIVEPHALATDGSRSHGELRAYLAAHGVDAQFRRLDAANIGAGERLLSEAANAGADLIVMGGYGHPRLREWVLGGVTRRILASMTVPVLMSH